MGHPWIRKRAKREGRNRPNPRWSSPRWRRRGRSNWSFSVGTSWWSANMAITRHSFRTLCWRVPKEMPIATTFKHPLTSGNGQKPKTLTKTPAKSSGHSKSTATNQLPSSEIPLNKTNRKTSKNNGRISSLDEQKEQRSLVRDICYSWKVMQESN